MNILRIAATLALLLVTPSLASSSAAVEIALTPYFGDLRTVPVEIGGKTVPFLLDTGGGMTILHPATVARMHLVPFGQATGFRFNGDKLTGQRLADVSFRIGGVELRGDAGVFDLDALGIKGVGGMLGLQSFEGQAITLDLGGNRLILETPSTLKKRVAGMRELTVRPQREAGGATLDLFARATAPVGDLWLEMDCGNTQPVLLAPHSYEQLGDASAGDSVGHVRIELAGADPESLPAQKVDMIYDGLLNSAYFKQHVVTFDLKAMRAWVAPRAAPVH